MDRDLALKLCDSAELSAKMQRMLWKSTDIRVLERLVSRHDLLPEIEEEVYSDDNLISNWARTNRDSYKIERASAVATSEAALLSLVHNRVLSPLALDLILSKATNNIAWELLSSQKIDHNSRLKALRVFNSEATFTSSNFGEVLLDTFGYNAESWLEALKVSSWFNSGIILQSSRYQQDSNEIEEVLLIKFRELDNFLAEHNLVLNENSPLNKDIFKTWESLLANYNIANPILQPFINHNFVKSHPEYARLLKNRLAFDFKGAIASLTCEIKDIVKNSGSGGDSYKKLCESHVSYIEAIITLAQREGYDNFILAQEALIHCDQVESHILSKALTNLSRSQMKELYSLVVKNIDFNNECNYILTHLLKEKGLLGLNSKELKLRGSKRRNVLLFLASIGSKDINEYNLKASELKLIYPKFAPARLNLEHPRLASYLLAKLDQLELDEREFALALLSHWEGDLNSLLVASKRISK